MHSRHFFILAACLLTPLLTQAQGAGSVNSIGLPSYSAPGYVIAADGVDADGGTNRHLIETQANVTVTVAGSYSVEWSLLDPDNNVMVTSTTVMGSISTVPDTRVVNGNLEPTAALPLQPGVLYRLRARLRDSIPATVHTLTGTPGRTYLHFPGTDPLSNDRNALTEITSVTIDRDWILEPNATNSTIPVTVGYKVHRYDRWTTTPQNVDIEVTLTPTMMNDVSSAPVAVTSTGSTFTALNVPGHDNSGTPPAPDGVSGFQTIYVDPSVILKPQMHHIDVQSSHIEIPSTSTVKTGGTFVSASTHMQHFTGKLSFGSLVTHFTDISSTPFVIPSVPPPGVIQSIVRIDPKSNSGTVDGISNWHYGDGTMINVVLNEFGDAIYTGDRTVGMFTYTSGTVLLKSDTVAARLGTLNGVQFRRDGDITLDTTGAHGELVARLPTGVGWTTNRYEGLLSDQVEYGVRDLNQSLAPADAALNKIFSADPCFLHEETKPIYVETTIIQWDTASGEFRAGTLCPAHSIRQPLLDFMASYNASYADPSVAHKFSNDHVYNKVTAAAFPKVKTGTSGGGELSTVLSVTAALFTTHMPYGSTVNYTATSAITITDDLIAPATSHLNTVSPLVVGYYQHCQEALEQQGCGAALGTTAIVTSGSGKLDFTSDGGLHTSGSVAMSALSWGAIPKALPTDPQTFAHQVTTLFPSANFLMAGTFLRGDLNTLTDDDAPGFMLLSGYDPANLAVPERPATAAYLAGLGDYAGANFRCDMGSHSGQSLIQGDPFGPYTLTARSKYYVRYSGVTGIHEAPAGGFPGTATIADYQFIFDSFGFSFLSTEQEDSRTAGELDLPDPTDFTLDFTEMKLSCLGAVESLEITDAGTVIKEFDFWDCNFTPYTATFVSTSTCNPGEGATLVLGFGAYASHFEDEIVGALGIEGDGTFLTPTEHTALAPDGDVPTRIRLPGSLHLVGSTGETYEFFPSQQAYLNDDAGVTEGFWSLFGAIDVPFFRDMQVHLHTRCVKADTTSVLSIMGGWPSQGWLEATLDPFTDTTFDDGNDGYTGASLAEYRDYSTVDPMMPEKYRPRAQQDWLGDIINFDYPLKWSNTAFNFTGLGPITQDVVVVHTQHELVYMDAENAEITFGVRYDGLPEISLTNFVFNAVDDATGVSSAMAQAMGDEVVGALETGVDEFANVLSDKAENLLGSALDAVTAPVISGMVTALKARINLGGYTNADLELIIEKYTSNTAATEVSLNEALNTLDDATTFLQDLDDKLERIEQGIDAVVPLTKDPMTGVDLPVEDIANGLLKQVEVDGKLRRIIFEALSGALVDVLSDLVDASTIEEDLAELIENQEPSLAAITEALKEIRALVSEVREQIQTATDLGEEIQDIINSPTGAADIIAISLQIELGMKDIVLSATVQDLTNLNQVAAEWQEAITVKVRDAFYATTLVSDVQEAVKERLYDLQASFNEAVDSAFAALNKAIRDALSEVLAGLDTTIQNTVGSFGDKLGAGSLTGYAHINGDSLDELRIDGIFELDVPDPMTINAYLLIKELDSDGPAGCASASPTGEMLTEVTIGTTDMELGWTGLGLNGVRADMSVKFGLSGNVPTSMGGAFEMTEGKISFETFEIYKLAASVMFGTDENYIAAAIGMRFGEFDVAGGVFFGRSCDLEPLKLIDPLVADVVPTATITGIYAYGEGTFPIFGTGTCFFNISAKAGAGVFYFQEGPTYGGRMTLGIFGEALCAVEVGAEISLAGSKSGDSYNFAGYGRVTGKAGACPLCVKANFQVDLRYTNSSGWDVSF